MEYNNKLSELMQKRSEIERQTEAYQNEISSMDHQGITNPGRYNELKSELSAARQKWDVVNAEIAELEGAAQEDTQNEINTAVYAALEGIPIAFVLTTETYSLEEKIDVIAKALSDEFEKAGEVIHSLRRELKGQESLIEEIRAERDAANEEALDLQAKLKNAAEQLDEEKRSSKEKDDEINRLREALSRTGTTPAKSFEEIKDDHIKALESRPAIYDLEWTDSLRKTHYTAKKAETGEQMEPFSRLTLGLYRVLEGDELERFREEKEKAEIERLAQEAIEHTIDVPSLPYDDAGVSTEPAAGEVVSETVTRCEFDKLAERVAHLEQQTGIRAVA